MISLMNLTIMGQKVMNQIWSTITDPEEKTQISTCVYGCVVLGVWNLQIGIEIFCFINKA